MTIHEATIAKIRQMPKSLVQEVHDYIGFLLAREEVARSAETAATLDAKAVDKPVIHLDGDIFGLILLRPSGVLYFNQTGGYRCTQSQEEGVFAPLDLEELAQAHDDISSYFTGEKWHGWCFERIDEETASFLDAVFTRRETINFTDGGFWVKETLPFLRVDRLRLQDSHEAWIYVEVEEPSTESGYNAPFAGFGTCRAVLTWLNSD